MHQAEPQSRDGCRDPLSVWNGMLLDGHNRLVICTDLEIDYETKEVQDIRSRGMAKIWIIKNQNGRRNLNASQRGMLAVKLEAVYAGEAKERQGARTDLVANLPQGCQDKKRATQGKAYE